MGPPAETLYWKALAFNCSVVSQFLFLATMCWDFFLTVLVEDSHRSLIFAIFPFSSAVIVIPWIIGIFLLLGCLIIFIEKQHGEWEGIPARFGFKITAIVYFVLFILAVFNPVISTPLAINYLVNIGWVISLMYTRRKIISGKTIFNNTP